MNDMNRFRKLQMDVLKEIGNIGSGNATTALSQLLNRPVNMTVPSVQIMDFNDVTEIYGGAEEVVVGIFLRVTGDAEANMFFIISQQSAKKLLFNFVGLDVDVDDHFSEMELSALSEVGNILTGSYLSSLSDFTKLSMVPSVPALTIDMTGAILSYGLLQYGRMGDQALFIDTKFLEGEHEIEGHFFLIPDPDSIDIIFSALGVSHS